MQIRVFFFEIRVSIPLVEPLIVESHFSYSYIRFKKVEMPRYQGFLKVFTFCWGGGGGRAPGGNIRLKIIICIKSGTLLGNIWGSSLFFFGGGRDSSQNRPPGSPVYGVHYIVLHSMTY